MPINKSSAKTITVRSDPLWSYVRSLALGLVLLGITQMVGAADPLDWLKRMQQAAHQLDYEGRFVCQTGTRMESLYIVHRVHGEHELERLVTLDGKPREVIRGHAAIALIRPGRNPMNLAEASDPAVWRSLRHLNATQLTQYYQMTLAGTGRVAGRSTQIIDIIPKDHLRYGHRLHLDQKTALPLKSILLDTQGRRLSQSLFVELKIGENITPIEHDLSALAQADSTSLQPTRLDTQTATQWFFDGLPNGYQQISYRYHVQHQREHFIFSDGLSAVSLYIEPPTQPALTGHANMGATRTLALRKYAQQILLVGEAPVLTLHKLAEALRRHD